MFPSAPRLDCTGTAPAVGYHHFHDDLSLNFQGNAGVQWIGPSAFAEVTELAARCDTYPEWIDGFLRLAETARGADRRLASAYYDRAAEFFMRPDDPRRPAAKFRRRRVTEFGRPTRRDGLVEPTGDGELFGLRVVPGDELRERLHDRFRSFRFLGIGNDNIGAVRCQPFGDRGADAARSSGNKYYFVFQC